MSTPYKAGWHSFKFMYGKAAFVSPILLTDEQREVIELSKKLLDHMDELAYGGIRSFVDYELLDQN